MTTAWMVPGALVAVALVLITLSGANDGGVLIAMPVRFSIGPAGWFAIGLAGALVLGPIVMGVSVARTLVAGIFSAAGPGGTSAFLIGAAMALAVVLLLTRWGLPTSLTLALIGALAGAGLGSGLGMSWSVLTRVLVIGALAPIVGALAGWLFDRAVRAAPRWCSSGVVRPLHVVAFGTLCAAYAVNDGQKMIAVAAVALAAFPGSVALLSPDSRPWLAVTLVAAAVLFVAGLLVTMRKATARIGFDLAALRPVDAVSAQLAAAGAVLASSALGAPVSMTQALAAGLVGVAASKGAHRVRWASASRIAAAWLVTLPAGFVLSFLLAWAVRSCVA